MRELYLMRHGQAGVRGSYEDDRMRPLTNEGRKRSRLAGRAFKRFELAPKTILTSPLVRTRETAEIVAEELGLVSRLRELNSLAIGSAPNDLLRDLLIAFEDGGPILAVGHEPDLGLFISSLISADGSARIRVKKGALIHLRLLQSGEATLRALIPPKTLDLLGAN